MADVMDKKKQQGTPEKDAEAEKELTILQPGAVPEEDEDPGLPDDMQAGGRLVSAGDITFSIQDIGYWDPNMIVFYGELSDGSAVELVQHISQLNLLLVAVPRHDDIEKPRRIIGFNRKNEPDIATDPED